MRPALACTKRLESPSSRQSRGAVPVNFRLTMIVPHLLEKNYKLMNRFFLPISITIPASAFTNPTMF
jgi:hypothetical protein